MRSGLAPASNRRVTRLASVWVLPAPALAAKKVTVGQLEDLLRSLQRAQKADAEVATQLKQVELTQELTRSAMNNLVKYVSGPLSTGQLFVLEALSADLIPPASDLPSNPAPDVATQKVLLAKAESYVNKTYRQLPLLTATRTTLRFQDNMEAAVSDSGVAGSAKQGGRWAHSGTRRIHRGSRRACGELSTARGGG